MGALRFPLLLLVAALVAAPRAARAQQVRELELTPRAVTMAVAERREVLASAYDARGDIVTTVSYRWVTSDPRVVRVEPDPGAPGVAYLIALAPGVATVDVIVGDRVRSATVQVTGAAGAVPVGTGTATQLHIEPTTVYLLPTEDIELRVVFLKEDGSPAAPVAVAWESFRPEVATVASGGRVVGIAPGQGAIEARGPGGLSSRVPVFVQSTEWAFALPELTLAVGTSDTVRVVVPGQERRPLDSRSLRWGTANPAVATVSPQGIVTAVAPGSARIVANGFGQELALPVTVHREVESLTIAPAGAGVTVPLGGTVTFRATPRARDDTPVPEARVRWEVGDPAILTLDPATGVATGRGVGTTTLTVRGPGTGLEKTWNVTVAAGGLTLDVERVALGRRERRTLHAVFTDAAGRPIGTASGVSWSSSDAGVVRVTAAGVLEPAGYGRADVIAAAPLAGADTARVYVVGEILVASSRGGTLDVYALERGAPADLHRVTSGPGNTLAPAYSPDRRWLAYLADAGGRLEVHVAEPDGSNPRRVTTTGAAPVTPSWTPDGRALVYEGTDGGSRVWIVDLASGEARPLAGGDASLQPAVSPDGRAIAYVSRGAGNYDVFVMDPGGGNRRNVTRSAQDETMPTWRRDGTLLFLREERSRRQLTRRVVSVDSAGTVTALTPPQLLVSDFAIAPAGDLIAATVPVEGTGGTAVRLLLIPLDGSDPVEVPRASADERFVTPAFRP